MIVHLIVIPTLFFKKKASGILQSPPSVRPPVCPSIRPSRYLLLNHWTKFNQIWCVSCSHKWRVQRHIFFCPASWGPGEGPEGQISLNIIKFQLQSQFQRCFNQTLCVFSHMKDTKYIRRDFHLATWFMPQRWDLGVPWGLGGQRKIPKFKQIWCLSYLNDWHMHHILGPGPLGPWGGAKRSNIIKSELQSQFQRFLNQTLCIFSQMKDI